MKPCIIIPTFDHSATVAGVARGAQAYAPVIVVNDGSTEPIPEMPGVHVIQFERNRGKGEALRAGFRHAREAGYTHAVTMDADAQHFPEDIPQFLALARQQPEALLVGVRDFLAAGAPVGRRRANAVSNFWFRFETGVHLGDTQCGFRCYPLEPVHRLRIKSERYAFELEVLVRAAWSGMALVPVPVRCSYAPEQVRCSHFRPVVDMWRLTKLNALLAMQACFVPLPLRAAWAVGQQRTKREITREFFSEHAHAPGRLAVAVGLGLFCGIAPIWGYQMMAAAALAHWLRLNKAIALIASNISIPPIAPFILWGGLAVGHWLFTGHGLEFSAKTMTMARALEYAWQWFVGSFALAALVAVVGIALSYVVARLVRRA